jgi:hypothetical protein
LMSQKAIRTFIPACTENSSNSEYLVAIELWIPQKGLVVVPNNELIKSARAIAR